VNPYKEPFGTVCLGCSSNFEVAGGFTIEADSPIHCSCVSVKPYDPEVMTLHFKENQAFCPLPIDFHSIINIITPFTAISHSNGVLGIDFAVFPYFFV